MSCENCNIIIRNVIGTPSDYAIRYTNLNSDGEVVYINRGPITAQDIRNQQDGYSIFVGGPGHPEYGQFWSGNTISIRFENFYNEECYLDVPYSCEPATTTTAPVLDCCDGKAYAIKTTGTKDDQTPLAGLSTKDFAVGTFQQTQTGLYDYVVDQPGNGKLCFPEVNRAAPARDVSLSWMVFLQNQFGQYVEADGVTIQEIAAPSGYVDMIRPWADNANDNEVVYVSPQGVCFKGKLDENLPIAATLVEIV